MHLEISCEQCGKTYSPSYIQTHIKRSHHEEEKKHSCEICLKKFYNYTRLQSHKKIHGGVKSYLCKKCMASFFNQDGLVAHKHLKHPAETPGSTPIYFCTNCHKKFWTHRQFAQHTGKSHKHMECLECKITFSSKSAFKNHKKIKKCDETKE